MAFGSFPLLALTVLCVNPLAPGDHIRSLAIGDQARSYSVHVPPSYDPGRPTPVVLALHAAAMNGAAMARFCGLNETADRSGFVVVYPRPAHINLLEIKGFSRKESWKIDVFQRSTTGLECRLLRV